MAQGDFTDVLEVLAEHGHEIMKGVNPDTCGRPDPSGRKEYICYSCYEGSDFFMELFGLNPHRLTSPSVATLPFLSSSLPLERGYVYHCELHTERRVRDPSVDQVHYFTLVLGAGMPLLLQTYGGVKGIKAKHIHGDVSAILESILALNRDAYRRLFEIPSWGARFLNFEMARFRYIRHHLWYPTLQHLDQVLSQYGLNFAREKMSCII